MFALLSVGVAVPSLHASTVTFTYTAPNVAVTAVSGFGSFSYNGSLTSISLGQLTSFSYELDLSTPGALVNPAIFDFSLVPDLLAFSATVSGGVVTSLSLTTGFEAASNTGQREPEKLGSKQPGEWRDPHLQPGRGSQQDYDIRQWHDYHPRSRRCDPRTFDGIAGRWSGTFDGFLAANIPRASGLIGNRRAFETHACSSGTGFHMVRTPRNCALPLNYARVSLTGFLEGISFNYCTHG
jgi:hypothetical protein